MKNSLDYDCPRCGAVAGSPCTSQGGQQVPLGSPVKHPHAARSALVERTPPACGTYGGYQAHGRHGEPPCEACREASRLYHAEYRKDPGVMDKIRRENAAQHRAAWRLVALHKDEFRALVAEERAAC